MKLKMAFHAFNGKRIVEVFDNTGRFVAAIYPDDPSNGIKIVSKYIDQIDTKERSEAIPAIKLSFT